MKQYVDGMNLFESRRSHPVQNTDADGFKCCVTHIEVMYEGPLMMKTDETGILDHGGFVIGYNVVFAGIEVHLVVHLTKDSDIRDCKMRQFCRWSATVDLGNDVLNSMLYAGVSGSGGWNVDSPDKKKGYVMSQHWYPFEIGFGADLTKTSYPDNPGKPFGVPTETPFTATISTYFEFESYIYDITSNAVTGVAWNWWLSGSVTGTGKERKNRDDYVYKYTRRGIEAFPIYSPKAFGPYLGSWPWWRGAHPYQVPVTTKPMTPPPAPRPGPLAGGAPALPRWPFIPKTY